MKRVFVFLLVFALCMSVLGCQSSTPTEPAATTITPTSTTTSPCNHPNYSESVTKDATCTQEGEAKLTCTLCGESHTEILEKLPHSYADASCTAPMTCTVCGTTEGDALGHSWDAGVVTAEPTEETEGGRLFTCTACGETKTESIPVLDHTHRYEATVTAPTCEAAGYTTYRCPCGDTYTAEETAALGHSWKDASCTKPKTCSVCAATEGEALGHRWMDATCTSPKTCKVCDKKSGKALGHTFEKGKCIRCDAEDPDWNPISQGLAYQVDYDGENCKISGIGTCTDSDIVIPEFIDGYRVTRINYEAFYGCTQMTSIVIPDTVTSIGAFAFQNCSNLKSVTIGSGLIMFGDELFPGCVSLEEIIISAENESFCSVDGVAFNKTMTELITYPQNKAGSSYAVPEGVTRIWHDAFNSNSHLVSITLPEGLKYIETRSFANCSKLERITIPTSVTDIWLRAFENSSNLIHIAYNGTMEQWNAIYFEDEWDHSTGEYIIYCTDGEIKKAQ